jgi:hypothetical protein
MKDESVGGEDELMIKSSENTINAHEDHYDNPT